MQEIHSREELAEVCKRHHLPIDKVHALVDRQGVRGLVIFMNHQMDSSAFGSCTALAYGSGCTYTSPQEMEGKWLNDLPSQRQYPEYIYRRPLGQQRQLFRDMETNRA